MRSVGKTVAESLFDSGQDPREIGGSANLLQKIRLETFWKDPNNSKVKMCITSMQDVFFMLINGRANLSPLIVFNDKSRPQGL